MKGFSYYTCADLSSATRALQELKGAAVKAGGTDLMDLLKERRLEPTDVVSLHAVKQVAVKGELSALATLQDVADSAWVKENFPAVHTAAAEAATPQIRNVGTVGGNLCQHSRCVYFRNRNFDCHATGGEGCPALDENAFHRYHAIFRGTHCVSAHTSNLAPALMAVGAQAHCLHPDGERTLDIGLLYDLNPAQGKPNHLTLRPGELIRAVQLKPTPLARNSIYVEFRERQSFDFAVASVAAAVHVEGGKVRQARIVCGAVAPIPYRARAVEDAMIGKALDPAKAAAAVVADAQPLAGNQFKVVILKRLVQRALEGLKA